MFFAFFTIILKLILFRKQQTQRLFLLSGFGVVSLHVGFDLVDFDVEL